MTMAMVVSSSSRRHLRLVGLSNAIISLSLFLIDGSCRGVMGFVPLPQQHSPKTSSSSSSSAPTTNAAGGIGTSASSLLFPASTSAPTPTRTSSSSSRLFSSPVIDDSSSNLLSSAVSWMVPEDVSSATAMSMSAAATIKSVQLSQLLESKFHGNPQEYAAALSTSVRDLLFYYTHLPLWQKMGVVVAPTAAVIFALLYGLSFPSSTSYRSGKEPYPRGRYDPIQAQAYYASHPYLVLQRLLEILRLSQNFIMHLGLDKYVFRNEEKNRRKRARELLELITKLGPTAIKVGQALSVRQDLIPDEYAEALATLQDQVPPFDAAQARQILIDELGEEKFSHLKGIGLDSATSSFDGFAKKQQQQQKIQSSTGSTSSNSGFEGFAQQQHHRPTYSITSNTPPPPPSTKTTTVKAPPGGAGLPVASASIGQVYRGFINGNKDREVAVKVQRPNVLAEIALDLHIVKEYIAPIYQMVTGTQTDLQSLANEWGRGFITELDYRKEAASTTQFNEEMAARNLNAVCAPTVINEYSSEKVLTTEWVDGTRIDQCSEADVPRLCSVALNAYLVMLLELQSLHCDPHPGNLLRTKDGRLCILDFGMTLDIDPNLQYSLLEYVAHLTSDNYDELPDDMVKLGFLKADKLEFAKRSGVLEPLKYFLKKVASGGGGAAIRERIYAEYRENNPGLSDEELRLVMRNEMEQQLADVVKKESVATGITVEVEELQRQNRDSFRVPEWFVYTSRAFLTLEGVSLQADPSYSIVKSCFPYVAKRLMFDADPRAEKALKDLLYGAGASDTDGVLAGVDVKRLSDLADGFTSYTTTTKTVNQQASAREGEVVLTSGEIEKVSKEDERKRKLVEAEAAITLAKDSADILLAPEGNLVQSILVEEGSLAASARFKDAVKKRLVDAPQKFRKSLPLGVGALLPPLPFEKQVEPFVRKTEQELKAQELATKLAKLASSSSSSTGSPAVTETALATAPAADGSTTAGIPAVVERLRQLDPEQAALVLKELRENLPKYAPMFGQLSGRFVSSLLKTASSNIETTLAELEKAGRKTDGITRFSAKRLSTAAQRSATVFTKASTASNTDRNFNHNKKL